MPSHPALPDLAQQFQALAPSWDAEHGPASARGPEFEARIRYLRGLCGALGRPRVLDLGCATGWTLIRLSDAISAGLGMDIAPAMIEQARQNAWQTKAVGVESLRFEAGDAAAFCACCSDSFDLVTLVGVLAHCPDPGAVLAGVKRVLAAGGRLVVITPHPWSPAFRLNGLIGPRSDAPPAHHVSPLRLRALAVACGFELGAVQALPYAPWPGFATVLGPRDLPVRLGRRNPFAGVIRGAFAAEFHHRGSTADRRGGWSPGL